MKAPALALAVVLAPALAPAQAHVALPAHVASGEAIVRARSFAAARAGDRVLVAWLDEHPRTVQGTLRTVVLRGVARDEGGGLAPETPDHVIAPNARIAALAWDGTRGAVAYVLPPAGLMRVTNLPRRAVPVPTAERPSPSASGGDVMLQYVDATGAPAGNVVRVFHENARAFRVAVALEGGGAVVAWTGAVATDDEVRGTVRAVRVDASGRVPSFASSTNYTGDTGDVLRVVRAGGQTFVVFTGARCRALEGRAFPTPFEGDPSARVEVNPRTLPFQDPPHEAPGPPVECAPLAAHAAEFHPDGTFAPLVDGPPLATDALALAMPRAVGAVGVAPRAALAEFVLAGRSRPPVPLFPARVPTADVPTYPPLSFALRERPAEGAEVTPVVRTTSPDTPPALADAVHRPLTLDLAGGTLLAVTADRRTLALVTPNPSTLATTRSMFMDVVVLPGASPWVLARDGGAWGGALLFLDPRSHPPATPPAPEPADDAFARLLVRARIARAAFTQLENTAGALAVRPDAPTNPVMPRLIAARSRLRSRWESACGALRQRAQLLVRRGAPQDVWTTARTACDLPGDLQLGVPLPPGL